MSTENCEKSTKGSTTLFWILLVAPAVLGLLSFLAGRSGKEHQDIGITLGLTALPVGLAGSLYCSVWLVRRYSSPGSVNLLAVFGLLVLLGAVNLFIVAAGCASSLFQ